MVHSKQDPIFRHPWFPWAFIAVIALLAYINAWPNVLVFDDREFVAGGRFSGLAFADYLGFFSQSLWEASGNTNNFYRPGLLVSFGIETIFFEDWPAGFHLVNITLHVLATLLVYGFLREVFRAIGGDRPSPDWPVLMAAMVFGVHPVMTDTVNSVFNGSAIYVAIGVCGGLWYLMHHYRKNPVRAWLVLSLLYFWALLYRENAAALPALAVLTIWFTSKDAWTERFRKCLPVFLLLIPLACYVALRSHALSAPDQLAESTRVESSIQQSETKAPVLETEPDAKSPVAAQQSPTEVSPAGTLGSIGVTFNLQRVPGIVPVWFDGLKLMVWPRPLLLLREISTTPWLLAIAVQISLLLLAAYAFIRKQPVYLFGLLFFYLAIMPGSRIISEGIVPPLLMERMLYLPSVGLMLCLAAGFSWLGRRTSSRAMLTVAVLLICILTPVTWARNNLWSDELLLLETDFAVTGKNKQLLFSVIAANRKAGHLDRSMELCELHPEIVRQVVVVSRECAKSAVNANRLVKAEEFFQISLERGPRQPWTHFEYARLLVQLDRRDEARSHFDTALVIEKLPFLREIMSAIMILDMYPYDRARLQEASEHVDNALQLQPRSREAKQLRQQLDQRL